MRKLLNLFFGTTRTPSLVYARAINESSDLLRRMREHSGSTDAARAVMADVWAQNHNVPFMTTVYETVQELKSGTDNSDTEQKKGRPANDP